LISFRKAFMIFSEGPLVRSLDKGELLRALNCVVAGLLEETEEVQDMATRVEPQLRELASS
jgi:hypothetical protein